MTLVFFSVHSPLSSVCFRSSALTGAKPVPTWWLVVVGLLGIAAGGVTFLWPGITAILLVLFIGAWALVHGIFEIIYRSALLWEIHLQSSNATSVMQVVHL